jgi:hypothetical protein
LAACSLLDFYEGGLGRVQPRCKFTNAKDTGPRFHDAIKELDDPAGSQDKAALETYVAGYFFTNRPVREAREALKVSFLRRGACAPRRWQKQPPDS